MQKPRCMTIKKMNWKLKLHPGNRLDEFYGQIIDSIHWLSLILKEKFMSCNFQISFHKSKIAEAYKYSPANFCLDEWIRESIVKNVHYRFHKDTDYILCHHPEGSKWTSRLHGQTLRTTLNWMRLYQIKRRATRGLRFKLLIKSRLWIIY